MTKKLEISAVLAIVGGALAGCCAGWSGLGIAGQLMAMETAGQMGDLTGTPLLAMHREAVVLGVVSASLLVVTSLALLVAGALALARRGPGRVALMGAHALAVATTIVDGALTLWSTRRTFSMMQELGGGAAGSDEAAMMGLALGAALIVPGAVLLVRLGLFGSGLALAFSSPAGSEGAPDRVGPRGD